MRTLYVLLCVHCKQEAIPQFEHCYLRTAALRAALDTEQRLDATAASSRPALRHFVALVSAKSEGNIPMPGPQPLDPKKCVVLFCLHAQSLHQELLDQLHASMHLILMNIRLDEPSPLVLLGDTGMATASTLRKLVSSGAAALPSLMRWCAR